ncbi:DUF3995 domain-containing protein [Paenibacillus sp. LMG 31460]|uniref:DUF3995 domain-containing protein n=1 Tax=Paenibacillus germinis TaxID=2654979 RepID=A0ABX1ZHH0_9BACL|nr:DUF3995 domain-containing protein [Paenibacillus germinis]NOU91385.1 DUF3995 domain-containing protein [Paenibacillus germinis]
MNFFERFTQKSVWPAYAGFLMAYFYAVFIRFYEAAGGSISNGAQLKDPTGFYMASYNAGVVILICGFILLTLAKPWVVPSRIPGLGGKQFHRLMILIPTLICTAFLLAHGFSGIITKTLHLTGVITIAFPHLIGDIQSAVLWDLLFYEPWFAIMGILAALTASHYAHATGVSLRSFRRGMILFLTFVILLTTLFVLSISYNSANFDKGLIAQFNFFS